MVTTIGADQFPIMIGNVPACIYEKGKQTLVERLRQEKEGSEKSLTPCLLWKQARV